MRLLLRVLLCVTLLARVTRTQDGDGFTDENRPYKFGFNIEGYQHRYEEKNEKGIIMGEYGFITGDGIYHLTVYATDENGNFKIVRTKNVYIGLPGEKTSTPVPAVTSLRPERVQEVTEKPRPVVQGVAGCGGCVIPTTAAPQALGAAGVPPVRGSSPNGVPQRPIAGSPAVNTVPGNGPAGNYGGVAAPGGRPVPVPGPSQANQGGTSPGTPSGFAGQELGPSKKVPQGKLDPIQSLQPTPNIDAQPDLNFITNDLDDPKIKKMMAKVPKMTDKVMTMEDLQALFYMFNYTLTYHGHNEVGNRAGDKNGSYFFNGRDGFGRNVNYIANEFGYQPNITLYDLSPEETPKEETEKNLTQLLGNEFKWFYGKG